MPRPIRPAQDWKDGNHLGNDPDSTKIKHKLVDLAAYAKLVTEINHLSSEKRRCVGEMRSLVQLTP
jgi:uncharacterized protein